MLTETPMKGWIRTNSGMTKDMVHMINELRRQALEACPEIINTFVDVGKGHAIIDKMQYLCMKEILDRGIGRPAQMMEIKHEMKQDGGDVTNMTSEQLQLLANNKVFELIVQLHSSGQLAKIVAGIEGKIE